ncbi:MAG: VWA domain-containing protein [Deltaproteobacteria bacterium]|nr:VWA domain-containing protein [Deltaproteobacteria bacterium]
MLDAITEPAGPSDEGLAVNIIQFSHLLRENGISVTLASVLDAIRGLEFMDISNLELFRGLLRLNFVCRQEDIDRFDQLFFLFWFSEHQTGWQIHCDGSGNEEPEADSPSETKKESVDYGNRDDHLNEVSRKWIACYSPDALDRTCELDDFTESRALYESIKKWLQPLRNRLSRRSQYSVRGKEITLRRILRKNMQFGGELILLDFKKKKIKNRRIIFLCDVSGSMDVYTLMLLQFAHALKRLDRRTEIFFFSTDLSRWTHQFDVGDFTTTLSKLPQFVSDWGGGTRIGHCLKDFNEVYGRRMLSNKAIVVIFSDGWDQGQTDILESQMAYLNNKAYKVIWLNPLMGTRDYKPICGLFFADGQSQRLAFSG